MDIDFHRTGRSKPHVNRAVTPGLLNFVSERG